VPLPDFRLPTIFLSRSRRSFAALPGLVAIRLARSVTACTIRHVRRSIASFLFFSWLRKRCALMTIDPSLLIRRSRWLANFSLISRGKLERLISNLRCTAVDTLFTFCPPGPPARMAINSISDSGILRLFIVRSIYRCQPSYRKLGRL